MSNQLSRRGALAVAVGALSPIATHALYGLKSNADRARAATKAKRIVYLFQSGGPSQVDLFDPKPALTKWAGHELPSSIRNGQRLTGMSANQSKLSLVASPYQFRPQGKAGMQVSDLLSHTGKISEELCLIRSMNTEQINHDPAITFAMTGFQNAGRPSIGAWLSYSLGSMNPKLPAYAVLVSNGTGNPNDQPLYDRLWGAGFLPSEHQGVRLRAAGEPVLYLSDPPGVDRSTRRRFLDTLGALNRSALSKTSDPEIDARIAQYELAYRMQESIPELANTSAEPNSTFKLYGEDARKPGTFAANCLLARRLLERDVRCVQLFHRGWDQHKHLPMQLPGQCRDVDQASAALVLDLKQRGLLEDTIVVWGGEFGRTVYAQGAQSGDTFGRDHHPRCFSVWMAGAGIRKGLVYGETDELGYNVVKDPVHVHDLNATILAAMGIDHTRLTYRAMGRDFRLTDVAGRVVSDVLL